MIDLERKFKDTSKSWRPYGISLMLTVALFFAIGSTHLGTRSAAEKNAADVLFYFPPPPPPRVSVEPQPLPTQAESSFSFDIPVEDEVVDEVQLDHLKISMNAAPDLESDFLVRLDRGLKPPKPNILNRLVVYEKNEVDEKPVRFYVPEIPHPPKLQSTSARLVVLYRVNENGRTSEIHILNSDNDLADEVAIKTIEGFRYRPAKKDGISVSVWVRHEMNFGIAKDYGPFSL